MNSENDAIDVLVEVVHALLKPFTWVWQGYTIVKLWEWFIVPGFGLVPIRLIPAMALILLVSFLTFDIDTYKMGAAAAMARLIASVVIPGVTLLSGLVLKLFL